MTACKKKKIKTKADDFIPGKGSVFPVRLLKEKAGGLKLEVGVASTDACRMTSQSSTRDVRTFMNMQNANCIFYLFIFF